MWAIKPDPGTNCLLLVTQEEYLMLMGVWLKAGPQCLSGGTGTVINSLQVLVTSIILPKLILPHMCMTTSRQERREVRVFLWGVECALFRTMCYLVYLYRTLLARSATGQSPQLTTGEPWVLFSCMTSPTRSLSMPSKTGEGSFNLCLSLSLSPHRVTVHTTGQQNRAGFKHVLSLMSLLSRDVNLRAFMLVFFLMFT